MLLPLAIVSAVRSFEIRRAELAGADQWLMVATREAAATTGRRILRALGAAESLAGLIGPMAEGPDCADRLSAVRRSSPFYALVVLTAADGSLRCQSDGIALPAPLPQAPVGAASRVTLESGAGGLSLVVVTAPLPGPGGEAPGAVRLVLSPEGIGAPEQAGPTGPAFDFVLFSRAGATVDRRGGSVAAAGLLPSGRSFESMAVPAPTLFRDHTPDGTMRLFAIVPMAMGEIFALGSLRQDEVAASGLRLAVSATAMPVATWLASLLLAWLAVEWLAVRRIRRLAAALRAFAGGERTIADVSAGHAPLEVREIADAYETMARSVIRKEAELEEAIHRHGALLREVHHRVKNNLQVIASIMNMHMRRARSDEAQATLQGLQDRVITLASIHRELVLAPGLADVQADKLLENLLRQIDGGAEGRPRRFALACAFDTIPVAPDQAVPLGLLLTETLAIAALNGRSAEAVPAVTVSLRRAGGGRVALEIDYPADQPAGESAGDAALRDLSAQLIRGFVSQLNGTVEWTREGRRESQRVAFASSAPSEIAARRSAGDGA